MLFGHIFDVDDARLQQFVASKSENFRVVSRTRLVNMCPWARYVPPFRGDLKKLRNRVNIEVEKMQELLDDHKKTFNPDLPRDYIDAFLLAQKSADRKEYMFTG